MNKKLIWFFFIAFIPRLIYLYQVQKSPFAQNLILDPQYYDQMAQQIMGGDLLSGDKIFDLSPFYSYFLALIYTVFGHHFLIARFMQAILGALNCLLSYRIATQIFGKRAGIISFFISSFYGIFFFYEGILETETLALFTNSLFLYLLLREKPLLSGVTFGLSAIIRPNVLIVLPFVMVWQYKCALDKKGPLYLPILLFLTGTFMMILPVTARNYLVEKDLVLISSSGGMNFYIGNNKKATGILTEPDFIRPNPLFEHKDARRRAEEIAGRPLLPSEASGVLFKKGVEFIVSNKMEFAALIGKKIYYTLNYYEIPDNINYYFFKRFSSLLRLPLFSSRLIIPLGLLGILLSVLNRERAGLLYIIAGGYTLFLLLFFVSSRYRLPLIPVLIIFSGYGVSRLIRERKMGVKLALYSLFFCVVTLFVNKEDPPLHKMFLSHSHQILSNILYENDEVEGAIGQVKQAVKLNPANGQASNNLAWIYADRGKSLDKALTLSLNAIKTDNKNSDYYDTLGWVYFKKGNLEKSLEVLDKGLTLDPKNKSILMHRKILKKQLGN